MKRRKPLNCRECEFFKEEKDTNSWKITCSPLNPKEEACLLKYQAIDFMDLLRWIKSPSKETIAARDIQKKAFNLLIKMVKLAEKEIQDSDGNADWKEKEDLKKEIEDLLKESGEEDKKKD